MKLRILGSSSSGNAALLTTPEAKILIDAGFSARRLKLMLAAVGESIEAVDAVFLTHEHGDHIAGLRGLSKNPKLTFFANPSTIEAISHKHDRKLAWRCFTTGTHFRYRDLSVTSFSLPHDASDPVGFVFESGDDTLFNPLRRLAWATDLGYASNHMRQQIHSADFLVIEANHDLNLLEACNRPWSTKQRIRGRHGHLSNEAALELLASVERPRWRTVCLGHLSAECNRVSLVERTFADFAKSRGITVDVIDPKQHDARLYDLTAA